MYARWSRSLEFSFVVAAGLVFAACGSDSDAGSTLSTSSAPITASASTDVGTTVADTIAPDPTTTLSPDPTTTAPSTSQAPVPVLDDPIVAITTDGDAVIITDVSVEPVLLFDGPGEAELEEVTEGPGPNVTDHVSVTPDGAMAYVGTCCEPISGAYLRTEPPTVAMYGTTPGQGYNPTVSPDGSLLAVGSIAGVVDVIDRTSGTELPVDDASGIPADFVGAFTPYDVMWTSLDTFVVLGTFENDWVVVPATIDDGGTVSIAPAFPVGEFTSFETVLDFAGYREDGEVVVHSAGDAVATVFDTDGTESGEVDLDGPSRSVWIEPGRSVLRVDSQGTLTIGDIPVPGDYQWART